MRLTRYFLPVLKENPAEAQIVSHRYMLRAGMIKQQAAGIYSWLPLGYRILKRIEEIVHQEQIRAGHIPLLMPTLQPADLWRESGRYDRASLFYRECWVKVDHLIKTKKRCLQGCDMGGYRTQI